MFYRHRVLLGIGHNIFRFDNRRPVVRLGIKNENRKFALGGFRIFRNVREKGFVVLLFRISNARFLCFNYIIYERCCSKKRSVRNC